MINEALSTNAYMLSRFGKSIAVTQHPYGSVSDSEYYDVNETVSMAEWLYNNTAIQITKKHVIQFIGAWFQQNDFKSISDVEEYLSSLPYKVCSMQFIEDIYNAARFTSEADIDEMNDIVCNDLNREFIRVRNGGAYNTNASNKGEITFRICPSRFNWFDVIWSFVYENKNTIKCITVVHDEESCGDDSPYKIKGEEIVNYPVDEFINLSGNPVIERFVR